MNFLFCLIKTTILLFSIFLFSPVVSLAQEKLNTTFSDEANKTTVLLKGIKLPKNKDNFSVGALFEYKGNKLEKEPCCVVIFLTSVNKKKFQYEENHNLAIWADKEKFDFGQINWQEADEGFAFSLSGIAFFEEMYVGMDRDKFLKIANAKKLGFRLANLDFK